MKHLRFSRLAVAAVLMLIIGVILAGCGSLGAAQGLAGSTPTTVTAPATAVAPTPSPIPIPPQSVAPPTSPASPTSPTTTAPAPTTPPAAQAPASADVSAAIQAVIQKANDEQTQAFAKNDPTIMQDTSTAAYYQQMAQLNSDMTKGGVASFKLTKLEWGPITMSDQSTAQATTYETWITTFTDNTTQQSRDQNVYTLVLQGGAWKIQADVQPGANPSAPTTSTPPGQVPPAQGVVPSLDNVSPNWSGYAASNGTFTAVTGTWTVPQPSGTGSFSSGATWVGIGGMNSRDLIQAGTTENVDGSGTIGYQAWIETLPAAEQTAPLAVSPGDSVTVSISEQQTNQWLIVMKNNTTGKTYQTTVQYNSSNSSAEWVEEAPSIRRGGILPLDNFGTVQFSGGSAVVNGKSETIAQTGAQAITMSDTQGNVIATPSSLTSNGSGFSISRSGS